MRLLRSPLLHFAVGGAVLFCLVHGPAPRAAAGRSAGPAPIVVAADDVARLRASYAAETGREPSAADEVALIERAIDEELLHREALARGLDRNDDSVRSWLVEQARVLSEPPRDDAAQDDDALYQRALDLGLDRKDLVVRRILVQKMRLLAARGGDAEVGEQELLAVYARDAAAYRLPERVTLAHVFFSSAAGRDAARARAEAALRRLRADGAGADAAPGRGDPFALAPLLVAQSPAQIEKVFGPGFAAAVARAPTGTWSGPIASAHGLHLVWIDRREGGAPPSFASVRGRVLETWREESGAARMAALLRDLRRRHPIAVESAAWQARGGA